MARRPYIARIALGRSPYEAPEAGSSASRDAATEHGSSSTTEETHHTGTGSEDRVAVRTRQDDRQLYDERGHPINPTSHEYSRAMRAAMNDIMAAAGVCEEKTSRPNNSAAIASISGDEQVEFEDEDVFGGTLEMLVNVFRPMATWWITSLRDRLLVFDVAGEFSFLQFAAAEYHRLGLKEFACGGLHTYVLTQALWNGPFFAEWIMEEMDRFVLATRSSRQERQSYKSFRHRMVIMICATIEVLMAPLYIHSLLQELALLPPKSWLPPLRALPHLFLRPQMPKPLGLHSVFKRISTALVSPILMVCAYKYASMYLQYQVSWAVSRYVLSPHNHNRALVRSSTARFRCSGSLHRAKKRELEGGMLWRVLSLFGWAAQPVKSTMGENLVASEAQEEPQSSASLHPAAARDERVTRAQDLRQDADDGGASPDELMDVVHPADQSVAFPPETGHASPSDAEVAPAERWLVTEQSAAALDQSVARASVLPSEIGFAAQTRLSEEPADVLTSILAHHISSWVLVPFRLLMLRIIAKSALTPNAAFNTTYFGAGMGLSGSRPLLSLPSHWAGNRSGLGLRGAGVLAGRVALCFATQFAIDLGVWSLQWTVVRWAGMKYFRWGRL